MQSMGNGDEYGFFMREASFGKMEVEKSEFSMKNLSQIIV